MTDRAQGVSRGAICLAVYRPRADLLERQIRSIAAQTVESWECLVGLDGLDPQTADLVRRLAAGDPRFRLIEFAENVGFYRNFERILEQVAADAEWVALSDQDDYWLPEKLERLVPILQDPEVLAVCGQARLVREDGEVLGQTGRRRSSLVGLLHNNQVTGSVSVFDARLLAVALPFPEPTEAAYHDHWLGVCAEATAGLRVVSDVVQDYVQHTENALGEDTRTTVAKRIRRLAQGRGPVQALDYIATQRWGWRVRMARELGRRVPAATRNDGLETIRRGRPVWRILADLARCVARGEVPATRAASLGVGAIWSSLRRGGLADLGRAGTEEAIVPLNSCLTIAFYLPQFHAIPENDEWWGEGFTEWVSVRRARPQFPTHHVPNAAGALGEYDLSDPSVWESQSKLARQHDIDAFCIYFYWFGGKRLLELPVEGWRDTPELLPYCLSWANEHWTRGWDGRSQEILMPQEYDPGYDRELFVALLPHFRAPHYLRREGKPILLVHRADLLPDPVSFSRRIRELAQEHGLPGVHLVAAETKPGLRPDSIGFDAVAEFPPVGANTLATAHWRPIKGLSKQFKGRLMSYARLAAFYMRRADPSYARYRSVVPAWDNTPRRQERATIFAGATPRRYAQWLASARERESRRSGGGIVFINAWNEWGEGAYLEPDARLGDAYLQATCRTGAVPEEVEADVVEGRQLSWSLAHMRSMSQAAAGSVLAFGRQVRNRWR